MGSWKVTSASEALPAALPYSGCSAPALTVAATEATALLERSCNSGASA